jgi:hypothetical protein
MNNYLSVAPAKQEAERLLHAVSNPALHARLAALFEAALVQDPRNARHATTKDLSNAPEWALGARAEGRPVHVFRASPRATAPLARAAARACLLTDAVLEARDPLVRAAAQELVRKCARMTLCDILARLDRLAELCAKAEARAIATAALCEGGAVRTPGACWTRLTSLADLNRAGRELHNCWTNQASDGVYARLLVDGQVWILHDKEGVARAGLAVRRQSVVELRGPRNAHFNPFCWDVVALMSAQNLVLHIQVLGRSMPADAEKVALWIANGGGETPPRPRQRRRRRTDGDAGGQNAASMPLLAAMLRIA